MDFEGLINDRNYDTPGMCLGKNGKEVCEGFSTISDVDVQICYCICKPGVCGRFCCTSCDRSLVQLLLAEFQWLNECVFD